MRQAEIRDLTKGPQARKCEQRLQKLEKAGKQSVPSRHRTERSSVTPFRLQGHVGLLTLVLFQATPLVVIGFIINRKLIHRLEYDQGGTSSWKVLETKRVHGAQRREGARLAAELMPSCR